MSFKAEIIIHLILTGTATFQECEEIAVEFQVPEHVWRNVSCNKRDLKLIGTRIEPHKFKPCCFGRVGKGLTTRPWLIRLI